jgi:hypothetical protein
MPQLKVTPRGVTFAEFALVSNWRSTFEYKMGGLNYSVLFSKLAHHTRWLFGNECSIAESRSTYAFILYSR